MPNPPPYNPATVDTLLLLSFLLPLISSTVAVAIRESYSWIVSVIAPFLSLLSSLCALYLFLTFPPQESHTLSLHWFSLGDINLSVGVTLDRQSILLLFVVTMVSCLVHLYSAGYMAGDAGIKRYYAMLGFFTFSMLGIVLSNNLLVTFIFWELVGFSSYMLIGHWKEKPEAASAARKAFIMNRIGDAGFLVGLMILWTHAGTFTLSDIVIGSQPPAWQTAAALCVFCGVAGKSAQFPLLTWLPDAMEGPTPVSALIHAATMVAAGVYLLARVFFLFTPAALTVVVLIGITTALLGACAALAQTDIKKVLAYSTISQLGLMVTAIGAGSPEAALLHLFTHAFFKACLFLSAGAVIHAVHQAQHRAHVDFDVQDTGNLGGLYKKLPFTCLTFIISGSALAGVPFFSGFLSKEAVLTALSDWKGGNLSWRWTIFVLAFIVSFFTAIYIFRLISKIFSGAETKTKSLAITEPPLVMRAPMAILALGSCWFTVAWNPFNFHGWMIGQSLTHNLSLTIFSAGWVILAIAVAYRLRNYNPFNNRLFYHNFYLDRLYQHIFINPSLQGAILLQRLDKVWIDGFLHASAYVQVTTAHLVGWFDRAMIDGMVNGMASLARSLGSFTRSFQGGKIQLYIFWSAFAIIIFLIWSLI